MLNNVQNNQPAFTSTVRMTQKTAKALNLQPQHIKNVIMKDINTISNNGRDDKVIVTFSERVSKNLCPMSLHVFGNKLLKVDVLERRGTEYYSSTASKVVRLGNEDYYKPMKIIDLYKTAKRKMKPADTVSNQFMQYV